MGFTEDVSASTFDSHLEIPTSGDPNHNAMLTLTLRYRLTFADSTNQVPGVIVKRDNVFRAVDSDGFSHPLLDWDAKARSAFSTAFQRGMKIWNMKFVLITPRDYSGLDFPHPKPGYRVRP